MKIDIERLLCSLIECNTKSEHKYNWLADDIITSLRDQGLIYKDGQIIPKLRESEDEKIRKEIIDFLELPHPQFVGKRDHEKWIAWLEKQGTPAKLSEEEQNRFAKGVLTSCAMSFINYLDAHKYEGKMCVSNGECEDIENAFHNAMWDRLHRYYCKYIEKQGEQKSIDNLTPQEAMDIAVEKCFNEQKPVDNAEPKFREGDWVVSNNSGDVFQVTEIRDDEYCLCPLDAEIKGYLRFIEVDNDYPLDYPRCKGW